MYHNIIILLSILLFISLYIGYAYYCELKRAEDEIEALNQTIDAMNANRENRPSTPSQSETLILRK